MTTTRKMVVLGAYANRAAVDNAVSKLISAGFETAEISILLPDDRGSATVENAKDREPKDISGKVTELTFKETKDISSGRSEDVEAKNTKIPQGAGTGAGIGAALGGTLGLFAALTGLVVPGIGPLLIAGPLFGAFAGATAGGAVGVLVGLGIPEDEAKLYEERLKQGGNLVSVHADNDAKATQARAILKNTGATDVAATQEAAREPSATKGIPRAAGR
ncbi:MAG: hypothetical protein WAL95_00655 [Candidatus Acidiferrales bacterium]